MTEYNGFKYWLVETKIDGSKVWRIQFPGGHKTPPCVFASEAYVRAAIDDIISSAGNV